MVNSLAQRPCFPAMDGSYSWFFISLGFLVLWRELALVERTRVIRVICTTIYLYGLEHIFILSLSASVFKSRKWKAAYLFIGVLSGLAEKLWKTLVWALAHYRSSKQNFRKVSAVIIRDWVFHIDWIIQLIACPLSSLTLKYF